VPATTSEPDWLEYHLAHDQPPPSWPGRLWLRRDVESPRLGNRRDLLVWTPPQADHEPGPFPVLYLHDAQNLFHAETSFAGHWSAGEALADLASRGRPVLAVGVPNQGAERLHEYSPFNDPRWGGGKGDAYLDFLIHTVRPLVNARFPATQEPQHTGLLGSSLGGLISFYGVFRNPETFGLCGALSPSFHFAEGATLNWLRRLPRAATAPRGRRIYLDVGTRERLPPDAPDRWFHYGSWLYRRDVARVASLLRRRGFRKGRDLLYEAEKGGRHHEAAWQRRFPGALEFLFPGSS
jgi:predicted alpha/beta superfamily hydrolase